MAVYVMELLIISLLGISLKPHIYHGNRRYFIYFTFLVLAFVSAFRAFSVGADTYVYLGLFHEASQMDLFQIRFEAGFLIFLHFISYLSSDGGFLLIVTSCFCVGVICMFVSKYSKNPTMSLFLYVTLGGYFFQMNAMRQNLAVAVSMLGFMFLLEKKSAKAAIMILLSFTIHKASLIYFFPYMAFLLLKRKAGEGEPQCVEVNPGRGSFTVKKALVCSIFIAAQALAFYPILMAIVNAMSPYYASYFSGAWSDRNYSASLYNTLVVAAIFALGILFLRSKRLEKEQMLAVLMISFHLVFSILSMRMEVWDRVSAFFGIYTAIIAAPEFVEGIRMRENKCIAKGAIYGFSTAYMLVILLYRPEWNCVVPYINRLFA